MTKDNSTAPARSRKPHKPSKPRKDFPLFAHSVGQWAKKIRGKTWYFGTWADPRGAENCWLAEKNDLLAGRVPRSRLGDTPATPDAPTLRELCNKFLNAKRVLVESGERSPFTLESYRTVCGELIGEFGADRLLTDILPEDFERLRSTWAARWGVVRLGAEINRARVVLTHAYKTRMVKEPMFYGESFERPSKKMMLLNRHNQGVKMFESHELRRMIDGARQPMRAMLLLATNAGLGNNDIGLLPMSAVDLDHGWINYPRPKTGVMRRCALWPETVAALKDWLAQRPAPATADDTALVFLTCRGHGWTKGLTNRSITNECRELLDVLDIKGARNFYCIRHGFETIGGESRDQVAVDFIMGHSRGDMASVYRERIGDDRLKAVTEHVRQWLFGKPAKRPRTPKKDPSQLPETPCR